MYRVQPHHFFIRVNQKQGVQSSASPPLRPCQPEIGVEFKVTLLCLCQPEKGVEFKLTLVCVNHKQGLCDSEQSSTSPVLRPCHHCVSVVSLLTTVSVLSASSPLVVVNGHCHQFAEVSNWTLTLCQSQMVASGQSNSYISKCTPPNSILIYICKPFLESNPHNQSIRVKSTKSIQAQKHKNEPCTHKHQTTVRGVSPFNIALPI